MIKVNDLIYTNGGGHKVDFKGKLKEFDDYQLRAK